MRLVIEYGLVKFEKRFEHRGKLDQFGIEI
jgi:hypothetical protein